MTSISHHAHHFSSLGAGPAAGTGMKSRLFYLAPNAVSSFWNDTAGVYLPKVPTWRSRIQAFKDTFLEFVEDSAFYFAIPVAGPILAKSYQGFVGLEKAVAQHAANPTTKANAKEQAIRWVGTPFSALEKEVAKHITATGQKEVLNKIAATKAGALAGAVAFASGFEYLIPHLNNLATKKLFDTVNFTAVAGLEKQRDTVQPGEVDIIKRAKNRLFQVSAIASALVIGSAALPGLLKGGAKPLQQLLKFVDFDARQEVNAFFDLSKPLLAIVIGHGVASYLDASQSSLERKETALRLGFVVPYLLAGGEATKNLLGWIGQNKLVTQSGKKFIVGDGNAPALVKWLFGHHKADGALGVNFLTDKRKLSDAFTKAGEFLNFNFLKSEEELLKALETVKPAGEALTNKTSLAITNKFGAIGPYSFLVKTLGMGVSVNLLAYALTRHRHKLAKQDEPQTESKTTAAYDPSATSGAKVSPLAQDSALQVSSITQPVLPSQIQQAYPQHGFQQLTPFTTSQVATPPRTYQAQPFVQPVAFKQANPFANGSANTNVSQYAASY